MYGYIRLGFEAPIVGNDDADGKDNRKDIP